MGNENVPPVTKYARKKGSSIPKLSRPPFKLYLGMILCSIMLIQNPFSIPAASSNIVEQNFSSRIVGTVVDKDTELPIASANISLPQFNLQTTSDQQGVFEFSELLLPESDSRTTISISASGYGEWLMEGALLLADDTLILDVHLNSSPVTIVIPESIPSARPAPDLQSLSRLDFPSIDQRDAPLPETIRVRVTGAVGTCNHSLPYTVEEIEFMDYVKHVLPYEWILSWPRESLRAGAMAAKMYAWQIVADGGRYDDADVYDSICDQVYIPDATYSSTNRAIEFTWYWRLTNSDGSLFRTHYMDWYWRCESYGQYFVGRCMGQWDTYHHSTGNQGYEKLTWDEMLYEYYWNSELSYIPSLPPAGFSLQFFGNGWGDIDRIKILVDDPQSGHLPVDVGSSDFTIEWWMWARQEDNLSTSCTSGGDNWTTGNVIFDRDMSGGGDHGEYGISLTNGTISFGLSNGSASETFCGTAIVTDGMWHHVAITRRSSDGLIRIFVDGQLDQEGPGPTGDISYRDGLTPQVPDQDPYLVIGARKSDVGLAYQGLLDEIRFSNVVRYSQNFSRPTTPFTPDANTVVLYPFNEGYGNSIGDLSIAVGGPSNGVRSYGGDPENGPEWERSLLFLNDRVFIPLVLQ